MIRVTVWNENWHEKTDEAVRRVHPNGLHETIASFLRKDEELQVRCATLDMPEQGLPEEVLRETDVLFWWGHCRHGDVTDETVDRVQRHVLSGMGLVVLHSGHESRVMQRLLGTSCGLRWHEIGEKERIFNIAPAHPVMKGIPDRFELPAEEMYGERFDIPAPDELLGLCWYPSGEVFRGICVFNRGGRIVYVQPGHETLRSYENEYIRRILQNAAHWAAGDRERLIRTGSAFAEPLERVQA